eukprot:8784707-Ditylum_brightwellii.AAC.1
MKCIVVEGISEGVIWSKAPLEDGVEATISNHFCLEIHAIKSAERTQLTEEKGKWFILYKACNECRVQNFVDSVLPWLFDAYVSEDHLVPRYSKPTRNAGNA